MLTDILRGSQSKKLLAAGLDKLSSYGKLSNIPREDVQFIIDWLIRKGFILQTKGMYPVLHPTYNGQHYQETITRQKLLALKKELETTESNILAIE